MNEIRFEEHRGLIASINIPFIRSKRKQRSNIFTTTTLSDTISHQVIKFRTIGHSVKDTDFHTIDK
jgi:hypothetical protein